MESNNIFKEDKMLTAFYDLLSYIKNTAKNNNWFKQIVIDRNIDKKIKVLCGIIFEDNITYDNLLKFGSIIFTLDQNSILSKLDDEMLNIKYINNNLSTVPSVYLIYTNCMENSIIELNVSSLNKDEIDAKYSVFDNKKLSTTSFIHTFMHNLYFDTDPKKNQMQISYISITQDIFKNCIEYYIYKLIDILDDIYRGEN